MKTAITIILIIALGAGFGMLLGLNVKTGYSTLIRIDNDIQCQAVVNGQEPDIVFESLRDTPFGDNIKILKVNFHITTDDMNLFVNNGDDHVGGWLDSIGIRNYPGLVDIR